MLTFSWGLFTFLGDVKMKNTTRTIIVFVCSFLIFIVGIFRIFTESLSATPLFVAYLFSITGLIGIITNGLILRKSINIKFNKPYLKYIS